MALDLGVTHSIAGESGTGYAASLGLLAWARYGYRSKTGTATDYTF
jgi:hypothetical protein